jgi:hypothetical protein
MHTLVFNEKFNYFRCPDGNYRPIINAMFKIQQVCFKFAVLIDSGADCTMLPLSITQGLAIDLKNSPIQTMNGIGGTTEGRFLDNVDISVGKNNFKCPLVLSRDLNKLGYGLLGRNCVFSEIQLAFCESIKEIYISHNA